jgi:hypothetical protein
MTENHNQQHFELCSTAALGSHTNKCFQIAAGADNAYDVFMDVDEMLEAPVLGDLVRVRPLHI